MLFSDSRLHPRHILFIAVVIVLSTGRRQAESHLRLRFAAASLADRFDDMRPMLSDRRYCFSCMSRSYLTIWGRLMHHYFPPKNFTEQCDRPTTEVGVVRCDTACFTVVEEEHVGGRCKMANMCDRCAHIHPIQL
jgi:hypothetical protein